MRYTYYLWVIETIHMDDNVESSSGHNGAEEND
jgi:hypothetical protein